MCIICKNQNTELGMLKLNEMVKIDCSNCSNLRTIPSLKNLRKLFCAGCVINYNRNF
jgi:hypothetical protein